MLVECDCTETKKLWDQGLAFCQQCGRMQQLGNWGPGRPMERQLASSPLDLLVSMQKNDVALRDLVTKN